MPIEPLWVAELLISERTAEKVRGKHALDPNEIRDSLVCKAGLLYTWHYHPERGKRALVQLNVAAGVVRVVLYPADHPLGDVYQLGTAYVTHTEQ